MKNIATSTFIISLFIVSCSNNEALLEQNRLLKQQIDLQKQNDSLSTENEILKENTTDFPSKVLLKKKRPTSQNFVDKSTQAYKDSVAAADWVPGTGEITLSEETEPSIEGIWIVKLTCSESFCLDVSQGDTKTEIWSILYENGKLVANTLSGGKLPSQYQGFMSGETLNLQGKEGDIFKGFDKYQMSMHLTKKGKLKGSRHVETRGQCAIDYTFIGELDSGEEIKN